MPSVIRETLKEVNENVFAPRSLRLELLKDYPETLPTLVKWVYDLWKSYDASLTKEKLTESFKKRLNDSKIPFTLVAVKNKVPIGVISLKELEEPELSDLADRDPWLGTCEVIPQERHNGLGEEMLKAVKAIAKKLGHRNIHMYLSNPEGVKWSVTEGAVVVEKRPFRGHTITILRFNVA